MGFQEALHHLVVFWDVSIPVRNTIYFLDIHVRISIELRTDGSCSVHGSL